MKDLFITRFQYYKEMAEKTFEQLSEEQLFWKYNEESNSIATLVKHLSGNMQSRWTNFLTDDGEKSWRNRDSEFENDIQSKAEMMETWDKGWQVLFDALNQIKEENWNDTIFIRGEKNTVLDAVSRSFMKLQNGGYVVMDSIIGGFIGIVIGYYMLTFIKTEFMNDNFLQYIDKWNCIDGNLDDVLKTDLFSRI